MWTDLAEEVNRYLNELDLSSAPTLLMKDLIFRYGVVVMDIFPLEGWVVTPDTAIIRKAPNGD